MQEGHVTLEGETLADRLLKGPLPREQTLRYGVQIADALDKAHRQGIVHRDLKPGNVMLTKSGVKLLDFGLAKTLERSLDATGREQAAAAQHPMAGRNLSALPTALTQEGTILGTFQYMAPEQLEGKEADARTDIFALGAVLYEMATGKKAFSGATQASLISSILRDEPAPISQVQPMSPAALDRIVRTCLAKDPEDRWQSAGDVAKELKWIAEGSAAGVAVPKVEASVQRRRERLAWAVAAAAILLAASFWFLSRRPQAPEELTRFTIGPPSGQSFLPFAELSPDARRIGLLLQDGGGRNSIAVRSLDSLELRRLHPPDRRAERDDLQPVEVEPIEDFLLRRRRRRRGAGEEQRCGARQPRATPPGQSSCRDSTHAESPDSPVPHAPVRSRPTDTSRRHARSPSHAA
jgi:hypothetical protein